MDKKYLEHIEHMLSVGLQYFLNFDVCMIKNALIIIVVLLYSFRLFLSRVGLEFYNGALTVKEDISAMKNTMVAYKQRWQESHLHEALTNNMRIFERFSRS